MIYIVVLVEVGHYSPDEKTNLFVTTDKDDAHIFIAAYGPLKGDNRIEVQAWMDGKRNRSEEW